MKLLLVGNFFSESGGTLSVGEELAGRLKKAGYSVITTSDRGPRFLRLLDMLATVWARQSDYEVAYVETYSGPAFLWAEMVCRSLALFHKPYLLALHGGNLPAFAKRSPHRVRRLLKNANKVTAPSAYLVEEMRRYRNDICLLPNAIELDRYPFLLRSKITPRLVWLRAFHALYNPQIAPLVIQELREQFPEITLTMVGPDKQDNSLHETRSLIEKLGLQTNIEIIPGVPKRQVPETIGTNDIFLNTTNVDNTPVSVLEAMACGLCIISTNVGGISYLLEHEKDALLVPPDDPQAMSAAVRRILTEPGLSENLSRNARKKAEEFDWPVLLSPWETSFRELIEA